MSEHAEDGAAYVPYKRIGFGGVTGEVVADAEPAFLRKIIEDVGQAVGARADYVIVGVERGKVPEVTERIVHALDVELDPLTTNEDTT